MQTTDTVRVITNHAIDPETEKLEILAVDAPTAGGASCLYQITGLNAASNDRNRLMHQPAGYPATYIQILFQNGPIPEVGVNGVTNEVLLAIVADRLRGFQSGPFACVDNDWTLHCVEAALRHLKERTRERMSRGVEGTYKV